MRKISFDSSKAFMRGEDYNGGNTQVKKDGPNTSMYLFNNKIAHFNPGMGLGISNAGWFTATTKERLNALPGVHIQQKAGTWYLNGNVWDGSWITVDTNK